MAHFRFPVSAALLLGIVAVTLEESILSIPFNVWQGAVQSTQNITDTNSKPKS